MIYYLIWFVIIQNLFITAIEATMENIYIQKDHDIILRCPYKDLNTTDNIKKIWFWEKSTTTTLILCPSNVNNKTSIGNRLSVLSDGNCSMKITNVTKSDLDGLYACELSNDRIYYKLHEIVYISDIMMDADTLTVTEDVPINITCTTSDSVPPASVMWYLLRKESSRPEQLNRTISTSYQNLMTVSTLTYSGQKEDNNGRIYCNATNSQQTTEINSQSIPITVYYKASDIHIFPDDNPYIVYVNQTGVNLNCSADGGNPPFMNYIWSHNSKQTIENPYLITVTKDSWGNYTCLAKNKAGEVNASLNLIVQYGPEIQLLNKQQAIEGSDLILNCDVSGNPMPTSKQIWWTRQNNNSFRQEGNQLKIYNIQKENSDMYTCHANNTLTPSGQNHIFNSATNDTQIDVLYKPVLYTSPNNNPLLLYVGQQNVQLICNASQAHPRNVTYWWTYNKSNYSNNVYNIPQVLKTSGGNYTCYGTNRVGTTSSTVFVDIQYGPSIDLVNPQRFIVGRYATIICNVTSYPLSDITWTDPNNFNQTGEMLVLNNTSKSDGGIYICTASNTLSPSGQTKLRKQQQINVNITILYKPEIADLTNQSIVEGKNLTVTCVSDANPPVNVYTWTKIGNNTFQQIGKDLVIPNIRRTNYGVYRCTANNSMSPTNGPTETGEDYKEVIVNVKYEPTILFLGMLGYGKERSEGQKISFKCEIDSYPETNVTWIPTSGNSRPNNIDYKKIISYYNISATCLDTGSYECSASNGIGQKATNETKLFVRCSPRIDNRSVQYGYNEIRIKKGEGLNISARYLAYPIANVSWVFSHINSTNNKNQTLQDSVNGISIVDNSYIYWQTSELTKSYMTDDDFGMYTVTFKNDISYASSIFYVEGKRAPDAPLSIVSKCLEDSTVHITWKPYYGGSNQYFFIQYRKFDEHIFRNWTNGITDSKTNMSEIVNGLEHGTKYYFRIMAVNENGETPSDESQCITAVQPVADSQSQVLKIMGASIGTLTGLSAIIIALLYFRRQHIKANKRNDEFSMNGKLTQRDCSDDEDGMRDNVLYEPAGPNFELAGATGGKKEYIYSEVRKPNRNGDTVGDVYAKVKKTKKKDAKKGKVQTAGTEGTIYENVENNLACEISGRSVSNQGSLGISPLGNPLKPKRNKDGLIYADLELQEGTKDGNRFVIRGIEDRTQYVEVDFSKRANPLLADDNECETKSLPQ